MKETIIFSTDIDCLSTETMFEVNATIEYEDGDMINNIYIFNVEINSILREDIKEEVKLNSLNINTIDHIENIVEDYFKDHIGEII